MDALVGKTRVCDRAAAAGDAESADRPWQPVFFEAGWIHGRQGCHEWYEWFWRVRSWQCARFEGERCEEAGGEHGIIEARGSHEVSLLGGSGPQILAFKAALDVAQVKA